MKRNLSIRLVHSADTTIIYHFYKGLSQETKSIFAHYPFTQEGAAKHAQEDSQNLSIRRYVLTIRKEPDGIEVVMAIFWFWDWMKKIPWFGIMIGDQFQGQGLGNHIMTYSIAEAKTKGKGGILLTTAKSNVRGQSLYTKNKFETIGEKYFKESQTWEYLMLLNFDDPNPYV